MSSIERNLTNLIKDIVFYYIKYYYDKHLKENSIEKIDDDNIIPFIDSIYNNNSLKIKNYIRTSLKENQKEQYNKIATENILLEMFNDIEFAKNRIVNEIIEYQNNNGVRVELADE
jgi:hypothetical protein